MSLPLPRLDDRVFETLVADAVRAAALLAPRWTDHNLHDPGITLIELFAWLVEQQQYYLDRVRPGHERKFLKLLGIRPRPAAAARATVELVAPPPGLERLPRGTPLAIGDVAFETLAPLTPVDARLAVVVTSSSVGLVDQSELNAGAGLPFLAFGEGARRGSRLYLGFDAALPEGAEIELAFRLFEDELEAPGTHRDELPDVTPSAVLGWEHSAPAGAWRPLAVLRDDTRMLAASGRLVFTGPAEMTAAALPPVAGDYFWLRATVRQEGYELAPRIDTVRANTLAVGERETLSAVEKLTHADAGRWRLADAGHLALHGALEVQVAAGEDLWESRGDAVVETADGAVDVVFDADPPDPQTGRVRLVAFRPPRVSHRPLGASTGLPGQSFRLDVAPVDAESLLVQVLESGPRWRDWTRVDDFDASGPDDRHFTLDAGAAEIRFGDGLAGAVPPRSETPNLRAVGVRRGGGERGNVVGPARFQPPAPEVGLRVVDPPAGGAPAETLAEAWMRARRELATRHRAVTDGDFEELARATPGLRVARAHALPLYVPGLAGYPEKQVPATVTVVVVPWSDGSKPVPSPGFLATVCRHLDRHRLITTDLRVVAPLYVAVRVDAVLVLLPGFAQAEVVARATEEVERFLDPLTGGPQGGGWPFGRTVHLSEIYQVLEAVAGVDCVERVALAASEAASGRAVARDGQGSVPIPPHALACSGAHRLSAEARDSRRCRVVKGGRR